MAEILKIIPKDVTASSNPAEAVAARSNNQSQERALNNTPVMPAEAVVQMASDNLDEFRRKHLPSTIASENEKTPETFLELHSYFNTKFPQKFKMVNLFDYEISSNYADTFSLFSSVIYSSVNKTEKAKIEEKDRKELGIELENELHSINREITSLQIQINIRRQSINNSKYIDASNIEEEIALLYKKIEKNEQIKLEIINKCHALNNEVGGIENWRERKKAGKAAEKLVLEIAVEMLNTDERVFGVFAPEEYSILDKQAVDIGLIIMRKELDQEGKALRALKIYTDILTNPNWMSFKEKLKKEIIDPLEALKNKNLNNRKKNKGQKNPDEYFVPIMEINEHLFLKNNIFLNIPTQKVSDLSIIQLKELFDTLQEYFEFRGVDVKASFDGFVQKMHDDREESVHANKIFRVYDDEGILNTSAIKQQLSDALWSTKQGN